VDRDDSCSLDIPRGSKEAGFEQLEIPVVTLNGLLAENKLPIPT
jgi:hypothetical protein